MCTIEYLLSYLNMYRNAVIKEHRKEIMTLLATRHQLDVVVELKTSLRVILARHKVHYQGVLDREDRVVGQILILAVEDLGGQRTVAFLGSLDIVSSVFYQQDQRGEKLTMIWM